MIRRRVGSRTVTVLLVVSAAAAAGAVFGLAKGVDGDALRAGAGRAVADPLGLTTIGAALFVAFAMRAMAWCRLVRSLSWSQSLAAIHLALGANHVLPFRLGEPLRITSVVRRTDVTLSEATATAVVLRAADVLSLILIGLVAVPGLILDDVSVAGLLLVAALAVIGVIGVTYMAHYRTRVGDRANLRLPDVATTGLVFAAWVAEAIVVWRVAGWFDVDLGPREAVAVLAAAVSAQIVAVTPGGVGTYEAAAAAGLMAVGADPAVALTAAVAIHAVKTVYSIAAGLIAVVWPAPSIVGHLRMRPPDHHEPAVAPGAGPVVLFIPAHDEEPRVAAVVARAPEVIEGRVVEVVVIDDGSSDRTADAARAAGATVVSHPANRGLGAAVRTGVEYCRRVGASAGAFCDADGEYDPAELDTIVAPILRGQAHYVVGTRFGGRIDHMLPHRRFGNRLLTQSVRFITGAPVTDGQSGFRAMSQAALASVEIVHDYNYAQVLTIDLLTKGFDYHEVGISYSYRRSGRSFVRLDRYVRRVVPTVWRQLNPDRNPTASPKELPTWKTDAGSVASAPLS